MMCLNLIKKVKVYSHVIVSKTKFNLDTLMDCIDYLESKGYLTLLRPKPYGVDNELMSITQDGIERIEKQSQDEKMTKTKLLEKFFPYLLNVQKNNVPTQIVNQFFTMSVRLVFISA